MHPTTTGTLTRSDTRRLTWQRKPSLLRHRSRLSSHTGSSTARLARRSALTASDEWTRRNTSNAATAQYTITTIATASHVRCAGTGAAGRGAGETEFTTDETSGIALGSTGGSVWMLATGTKANSERTGGMAVTSGTGRLGKQSMRSLGSAAAAAGSNTSPSKHVFQSTEQTNTRRRRSSR